MQRFQAFKFERRPNGPQTQQSAGYAAERWFVPIHVDTARALHKEPYKPTWQDDRRMAMPHTINTLSAEHAWFACAVSDTGIHRDHSGMDQCRI